MIILLAVLSGLSKAELELRKNRRANGPSGLVAFPRVGRSDPNINNNNNLHETDSFDNMENVYTNSLEDYDGRTDAEIRKWARLVALQQALDKRTGPSATSGLWFGPRLGKRSVSATKFAVQEN